MSDLVAQLRDRRRALRLSQREVGERMGLTAPQSRISEWERRLYSPSLAALEAWAAALGSRVTLASEIILDTLGEGE